MGYSNNPDIPTPKLMPLKKYNYEYVISANILKEAQYVKFCQFETKKSKTGQTTETTVPLYRYMYLYMYNHVLVDGFVPSEKTHENLPKESNQFSRRSLKRISISVRTCQLPHQSCYKLDSEDNTYRQKIKMAEQQQTCTCGVSYVRKL